MVLKMFIMSCLLIYCVLLIFKIKQKLIKNRELILIKEQELINYKTSNQQKMDNVLRILNKVQINLQQLSCDDEKNYLENIDYTFIMASEKHTNYKL